MARCYTTDIGYGSDRGTAVSSLEVRVVWALDPDFLLLWLKQQRRAGLPIACPAPEIPSCDLHSVSFPPLTFVSHVYLSEHFPLAKISVVGSACDEEMAVSLRRASLVGILQVGDCYVVKDPLGRVQG